MLAPKCQPLLLVMYHCLPSYILLSDNPRFSCSKKGSIQRIEHRILIFRWLNLSYSWFCPPRNKLRHRKKMGKIRCQFENRCGRLFNTWIRNQCRQIIETKHKSSTNNANNGLLPSFRVFLIFFEGEKLFLAADKSTTGRKVKKNTFTRTQRYDKNRNGIIKYTCEWMFLSLLKHFLDECERDEPSWSFNQSDYKSILLRLSWLELVIVIKSQLQCELFSPFGFVCWFLNQVHDISWMLPFFECWLLFGIEKLNLLTIACHQRPNFIYIYIWNMNIFRIDSIFSPQ